MAAYGPGGFLGELDLMTGETAYLTARVSEAGRIHRISAERFRRIMADAPEISDVLLQTFSLAVTGAAAALPPTAIQRRVDGRRSACRISAGYACSLPAIREARRRRRPGRDARSWTGR